MTKFLNDHPGGPEIILDVAGKDAHEQFEDIGHSEAAKQDTEEYLVGKLHENPEEVKAVLESRTKRKEGTESSGSGMMTVVAIMAIILAIAYAQFSQS